MSRVPPTPVEISVCGEWIRGTLRTCEVTETARRAARWFLTGEVSPSRRYGSTQSGCGNYLATLDARPLTKT